MRQFNITEPNEKWHQRQAKCYPDRNIARKLPNIQRAHVGKSRCAFAVGFSLSLFRKQIWCVWYGSHERAWGNLRLLKNEQHNVHARLQDSRRSSCRGTWHRDCADQSLTQKASEAQLRLTDGCNSRPHGNSTSLCGSALSSSKRKNSKTGQCVLGTNQSTRSRSSWSWTGIALRCVLGVSHVKQCTEALDTIRIFQRRRGVHCWRRLCTRYNPANPATNMSLLKVIFPSKRIDNYGALTIHIESWERLCRAHRAHVAKACRRHGAQVLDGTMSHCAGGASWAPTLTTCENMLGDVHRCVGAWASREQESAPMDVDSFDAVQGQGRSGLKSSFEQTPNPQVTTCTGESYSCGNMRHGKNRTVPSRQASMNTSCQDKCFGKCKGMRGEAKSKRLGTCSKSPTYTGQVASAQKSKRFALPTNDPSSESMYTEHFVARIFLMRTVCQVVLSGSHPSLGAETSWCRGTETSTWRSRGGEGRWSCRCSSTEGWGGCNRAVSCGSTGKSWSAAKEGEATTLERIVAGIDLAGMDNRGSWGRSCRRIGRNADARCEGAGQLRCNARHVARGVNCFGWRTMPEPSGPLSHASAWRVRWLPDDTTWQTLRMRKSVRQSVLCKNKVTLGEKSDHGKLRANIVLTNITQCSCDDCARTPNCAHCSMSDVATLSSQRDGTQGSRIDQTLECRTALKQGSDAQCLEPRTSVIVDNLRHRVWHKTSTTLENDKRINKDCNWDKNGLVEHRTCLDSTWRMLHSRITQVPNRASGLRTSWRNFNSICDISLAFHAKGWRNVLFQKCTGHEIHWHPETPFELLFGVPVEHRSDTKDWFRAQRVQLRDTCLWFLEETTTVRCFCIIRVTLLVLCFEPFPHIPDYWVEAQTEVEIHHSFLACSLVLCGQQAPVKYR